MSAYDNADIGKRIRLARKDLELSQDEFGARIGYTQGKISRLENGKLNVTIDELVFLADCLGKNFLYFFEGDDIADYLASKGLSVNTPARVMADENIGYRWETEGGR